MKGLNLEKIVKVLVLLIVAYFVAVSIYNIILNPIQNVIIMNSVVAVLGGGLIYYMYRK